MANKKKQKFSDSVRQAYSRNRATTTTTGSEFDAAVNNVRNGTMPAPADTRGAGLMGTVLDRMQQARADYEGKTRAARLQGYSDGTINPYATLHSARLYERDLAALYGAAEAARPKNFMQQVQSGQIWGVGGSYDTANRLKRALTQHQNIMSGVTDAGSFRQNVAYPMKYAGRDLNGILQAMAHLNQTGQGNSEEYKWLKEHQYDYWTEDDFKKQIAYLEGELDSATRNQYRSDNWQSSSTGIRRKNNGSGYMYDLPTAADRQDAEARQTIENLKMQLADLESRHTRLAYSNALANMDNETYMLLMNYAGASEAEKARARRFGYENSEGSGGQAFKRLMADGYSRDEALALLDYAEKQGNARNRQRTAQAFDDLANSGILGAAASTVLGVPMRLAGGVLGFADAGAQYLTRGTDPITGRKSEIDWNTAAMEFYHAGQDASGAVSERIKSSVGKFAYNLLNSMLDSAAVAPIPGGEVLLGFSAAMQSAEDAKARGASDGQALLVGFFSGAAETACEHLPLERIRGLATSTNSARRTLKTVLLDMGKQAGMEGTEELVTDILNRVSDDMIMGAMSEYNTRVRELMAQGMSREEAERKATGEWVKSVGEDFLAGALSGGIMGGGAMVVNQTGTNVRNQKTGARINANDYGSELREYAAATPEGSESQRLLGRLDNASGRKANRLTGALYNAVQTEGFRQAIQTRLQELGATSNASATAEAIQLQAAGAELTQQQRALTRTRAAQRVLTEFQSAIEGYTGMTNEWAYDAMRGAYEMDQKALKRTDTKTESGKPNVTEFAKRYGEQAVAVDEVRKLQPELDSETFERQFETAYKLGRGGAQMDVAMNTTATADLTETQRQTAWEMGRAAAEATIDTMEGENENGGEVRLREGSERNDGARAAEPVRGLEEGAEPAKGYPAVVARSAKDEGADSVEFRPEAVSTRQLGVREGTSRKGLYIPEESSYTPAMKEAVRVAEEHGRKIVLFGGGNLEVREDGYVVSARGMYDEATNTVYVRADHPEYTADQIARHENGHGMIADGSIDVEALQKQIAASMTEAELRQAVSDYVDLYDGTGLKEEQIIHEMICDALGNMNVFAEIDVFKEQAQRAERTMPTIRSAVQEQQKGRAPPEKAGAKSDSVSFSMETPVEKTKTLIAWHNMSTDALNGALELGGLAMPSWAIKPSNKAHSQYGDVSVIAPRELVDPKRNRNSMIFGGDAWTPVFPEVNYKVSYEAAEALEDEIKALVGNDVFRQIGGAALDTDNIADQFKRSNGRLSGHYANNLLLKYAYLKSIGSNIEAPQKEENLYYGGDFTNEDVRRFVGRINGGKRTLEKLENMSVDELFEQDDMLRAIADVRRISYQEKFSGKEMVLDKLEKDGFFSKDSIKFTTIDRMLKAARKYLDSGVQQTVDKKALQEIIDREVDQSAYEEWIFQKLSDTVERKGIRNNKDLFTPSGNRRSFDQLNYAYTLANIVKAMKAQPKQGRAQFLSGPGSVRGAAMKSYKDVEQARAEIGRVIDNEDDSGAVDAAFDSYNENLSDILDRMAKNGDKFDAANAVIEILQNAKTESGIYNYMQRELKDWYNVSPELAHDIYELIGQVNALPIPYFEGKTYDAVRFDDVLAVVVPDTISEDLKKRLEDTGAQVLEYKKNDEDDRLRVVNSVEGAAFSRDIESVSELRQENRALRERLERAKAQTRRTTEAAPRAADIRMAAKNVIEASESGVKVSDVEEQMTALAAYMMNGEGRGKSHEPASWSEVKDRAVEIAQTIVDSTLREGSDVELYDDMRKFVRGTKMTLAAQDRADLGEAYGEFVKRNSRVLRMGNDGLSVDAAYQELQDRYGKGFFPDEITHPADQLMRIADVVNGLEPIYERPGRYYDEAVEWTANAIIDELLGEDVRQEAPTFADKAEARRRKDVAEAVAWERYKGEQREDRLRERYAKRMKDALQKAKERRARDIDRLKLKQKFRESARKERSAQTALWNKILDLKKDFRRMVEKPQQADSKHAPLRLARALDGVTSCFSVEDRKRVLPISELDRALGKLRDVYKLAEKDDELALYYDEGLIDNIDAVRTMLNEVDPFDATLDSHKLQKVYDLLKMCKHNVTTANQFVSRNWAKTIIEAGRKWAAEVASASVIFKKGFGAQILNYQLRPDSMFARFSGFAKNSVGEQIQEMFVDGEEKMLRIQQDFYYAFERFSKSKEFDKLTRHGKASLVDVGLKDENGNAIKLTRDQMLALYMNLRSEDNILALAYGGANVPVASTYYTGKVAKSFDDSVRTISINTNVFKLIDEARNLADEANAENVTDERRQEIQQRLDELQSEVKALEQEAFTNLFGVKAKIEKQLTKFEKDLVEAADDWMLKSKDYINAETKAMYGIEKAQVEHYWPIHRDMNFVNTDMREATNEINLENWGSLKERVKSKEPIKLTGFVFELDNHTQKMSQFCGFAAVQRDFDKLMKTRMPYQHSTLKEQISKKFGSDSGLIGVSGMEYIDNYIAAVSGATNKAKPSLFAWARRNLPRATLSANFRVALSQVASVPTAAAEVGWGAMAKGFARYSFKGFSAKQIEALAKSDPWFWQRSRGDGGMREFAESKDSTFALDRAYNKVAGTKLGKALLNWCQKFDMYATFTQWAMAEEWVKKNRKDLKQGSDAFNEAVSRKYRDILRKTQPNYTVTERSDLLRDNREAMKWATMYKTQSNQNLNILYDATARLRQYTRDFKNGRNGVTQEDLTEARRQFARAYTGVILGGTVTFVLFRALANALMHAMNPYRDDDEELSLKSFLEGLEGETFSALAGMFLFGSEIEEFVFAAVTGDKYWGLSDSAISSVSDVLDTGYKLTQDLSRDNILKFVNSLSAPLGIPSENVKKIVNGILYHIEDIRNGEFLSFEAGVNRTTKQQAHRFAQAMENGDTAKMDRIYKEMVASSTAKDPEGNTQGALRDQIKAAFIGEDGKSALSESEALKLLEQYGGKSGDDAQDLLNTWKFERDYGFKYDQIGDEFLDGNISESEYKKALMNYGGKSEEDAVKTVGKKKVLKDYGFEYSEDNIVDAAKAGDITTKEAYEIWTEYLGVSEKDAQNRADKLQFVVDNPGVAYDDVTTGMVDGYNKYIASAKSANIRPLAAEDYVEYYTTANEFSSDYDENGKAIKGSEKKDKVFAYIAGLNISADQKTAIALSMYSEKTVNSMRTW